MSNRSISIAQTYADAIFDRVSRPIEPPGFTPNWADHPLRHTVYPDAPRYSLAEPVVPTLSLGDALAGLTAPPSAAPLSFAALSAILRLAHGPAGRRLAITWNGENASRTHYHQALYGRGTASGGGLYPTELYLASGPSGAVQPGVYHYASGLHALEQIAVGDPTPLIRQALLDHPAAAGADQFLLVGVDFWKNAYKYNNFSYHVVTQDTGALLGSLRLLAAGYGANVRSLLWFHDAAVNQALGLTTVGESVLAVLPLNAAARPLPIHSAAPPVRYRPFQRSRTVVQFPMVEAVHAGALVVDEPRPDPATTAALLTRRLPAATHRVALPPVAHAALAMPLVETLRRRSSSFGRFSARTPMTAAELATMLASAAAAAQAPTDLVAADPATALTGLMVFVNHVRGIAPGIYRYDPAAHELLLIAPGDSTAFQQRTYFLNNYNLAEVGALIVLTGRLNPALRAYGNRGLRLLNLEIGAMVQTLYLAGTALGLGCGAALGFDNAQVTAELQLARDDERAILWLMVGHERPVQPSFTDYLF